MKYSSRMKNIEKSMIREILKLANDKELISFAGGLPNPLSFPVNDINEAASKVLGNCGNSVLQYSTTEGYLPLREFIAARYRQKQGLVVSPDEILITNGAQQALDLLGKVFIDPGDDIIIERPGYLGAIQAFSVYEPNFVEVTLNDDGVDLGSLKKAIHNHTSAKFFYSVPNFQNPSGTTYSLKTRQQASKILNETDVLYVEDNPYGELRFLGEDKPSMKTYLGDKAILIGSFSKIVSPGMRLGWVCAKKEITEQLVLAKQACDLHSNYFAQRVLYQYLIDNNIDEHIETIKKLYKNQRECMVQMIENHFPSEVSFTKPEGGMFLWATLPENLSSLELFDISLKNKVAFVPGVPFYALSPMNNTLRLNYTNTDEQTIEIGIKRLGKTIENMIMLV